MAGDRFGFLVHSLEELHERLKAELARNPFLDVHLRDGEGSQGDDAPPPPRDPGAPD